MAKDGDITGDVHANGAAALSSGVLIDGDLSASGSIALGGATVTGTVTPFSPSRPLPSLPSAADARGLADRVFEGNHSFPSGTVIDDVVFVAGQARFLGSINGTGTVIAGGQIRFDNVSPGQPAELEPGSRMSFVSLGSLWVGKDRELRGELVAGGAAQLHQGLKLSGLVAVRGSLAVHKDALITYAPPAGGEDDDDPPEILNLIPADGSVVPDATPEIAASYSDDGSGIDSSSVRLFLDGIDRTAEASISPTMLEFTPAADLADGVHEVAISVRDLAGNEAQATWTVTVDTQPPLVSIARPEATALSTTSTIPVVVSYSDGTSSVDIATLTLVLDGQDLGDSCAFEESLATCISPDLVSGSHLLVVTARDLASNATTVEHAFNLTVDLAAPQVAIISPEDGALINSADLIVTGMVSDDGQIAAVTLNGQPVEVANGTFSASVSLVEGPNELVAVATDTTGKQGEATASAILDTVPPTLTIEAPVEGQLVNQATVRVEGIASDERGIDAVEVNGTAVVPAGVRFLATADVEEGDNSIVVRAIDAAGNVREASLGVVGFSLPEVEITDPLALAYLATTTVDVSGTVSPEGSTVTVNGVVAEVSGGTFTAPGVPLVEGGNILTATVTDAGRVSTDSVNVVRDLSPPHLRIYVPVDGSTVHEDAVSVSGLVNDIVPGTVNAGEVSVTVNGVAAQVANRSFLLPSMPLAPGANTIEVTATDTGGNTGTVQITVHREPATTPRVAIVSGDGQTATIGSPLPEPLTVVLLDASGLPVPGRPVLFRLRRSNGILDDSQRQVAVETGPDGTATVQMTLGTRAGVGAQSVEAESAGFAGPAVFTASALPGEPALIVVDSGGEQIGIAGRSLPRPLIAAVTDAGFNRLEGVPVRFLVVEGAGRLDGGSGEKIVTTDSDGRAIVDLTLDTEEGVSNNVVEAQIDGQQPGPLASWTATGMAAGDPALTSISGVVLDNSNLPVPGATLRIRDTAIVTQTDAAGTFRIEPAPVGTLYLIVDGSTVTRPGSWPDLEFVVTTIPGRDKTLGMPIYLLPIDLANGLFVSETEGGTLTLPAIPGFALEVEPGSVTFPSGLKTGVVSVTMVHSDRVPMTPNFGQQPRLIVTIQPAGARFDPPARLTLPNVEGLAAGEVTDFYSFDHDLGHFVSIGPGTVSEDGTVIVSNPGVGIVKAGWHCGGNPTTSGTAHDCPDCYDCVNNRCVASVGGTCDDGDECTANDHCDGGACLGDRRQILSVEANVDGEDSVETRRNEDLTFTAEAEDENCDSLTYEWDFGDGDMGSGQSATHAYAVAGTFTATVTVTCNPCSSETGQDSVTVEVKSFEVEIEEPMSGDHFDIRADPPQMPEVPARARIVGLDPDPTAQTAFTWTVTLALDRAACPNGVGARFEHPAITETVTGPDYMPQFQELLTGDLEFEVEATIDGETDDDQLNEVEIHGTNPPRAAIHGRMPHDTLGRIACQESGFRQFNGAAAGGTEKCPLFSADGLGGVGIMQITNPAPTREEHFDWHANVDRGINIFTNQKVPGATNYPGRLGRSAAFQNLVQQFNLMRMAQNLPPINIVVPAFTTGDFDNNLMQLERDAIRGYNGWGGPRFLGLELHEYRLQLDQAGMLVVDLATGEAQWEEVPVAARGRFGDPDYVNNVLGRQPDCP